MGGSTRRLMYYTLPIRLYCGFSKAKLESGSGSGRLRGNILHQRKEPGQSYRIVPYWIAPYLAPGRVRVLATGFGTKWSGGRFIGSRHEVSTC
jgi:hypothetical protein